MDCQVIQRWYTGVRPACIRPASRFHRRVRKRQAKVACGCILQAVASLCSEVSGPQQRPEASEMVSIRSLGEMQHATSSPLRQGVPSTYPEVPPRIALSEQHVSRMSKAPFQSKCSSMSLTLYHPPPSPTFCTCWTVERTEIPGGALWYLGLVVTNIDRSWVFCVTQS